MQVLYGVCCGLDVHKKEITAALMTGADDVAVKTFKTTTSQLHMMMGSCPELVKNDKIS